MQRGRYRLAAAIVMPATLLAVPIVSLMDRLDRTDPYAWAVLAVKK